MAEPLLQQLNALSEAAHSLEKDERRKVIDRLRTMRIELEDHHESAQRLLYTMYEPVAIRIGIDLGIFRVLHEANGPVSFDDLVRHTKAAPMLLSRLLRYMAAMQIIQQTSVDTFAANNVAQTIAIPGYEAGFRLYFDFGFHAASTLPKFLKDRGYQDVSDPHDSPVPSSFGSKEPLFVWIQSRPDDMADFGKFMEVQRFEMPTWLDAYPYHELVQHLRPDQTLFVDVAGSFGHQSKALRAALPDVPNKIVVQDLPETIAAAPKHDGVEFMVQDFFQAQQIKGARAYYLRNILHDWPDKECVRILRHLKDALDDSGVILIDEMILPENNVHWQAAQIDIQMLVFLSAVERTQKQWDEILTQAGLKIKRTVEYSARLGDTVMECVPL